MNIYLIGFMGSGKTTVGQALAKALTYKFIDTDDLITDKAGESISHIFKNRGEEAFRKIEKQVLRSLEGSKNTIISTGGGMPCYNDNIDFIKDSGVSIYLHLKPQQLVDRLKNEKEQRPLLTSIPDENSLQSFIQQKITEREKEYFQADIIYDASLQLENLVAELKGEIELYVD